MVNFLEETIDDITKSGHTPEDIIFIGSVESGYCCTWEEFLTLADFEYDNFSGWSGVADDLCIVFKDKQQMQREYNEICKYWQYFLPFEQPKELKKITSLQITEVCECTLKEIHESEETE
jgi:hypothetical protein